MIIILKNFISLNININVLNLYNREDYMIVQIYGKQDDLQRLKPFLIKQFSSDITFEYFNSESILIPTDLNKSSFFIVLFRKSFLQKGWFFYLMGYLSDSEHHALLFTVPSEEKFIPDWISDCMTMISNPRILRMKIISAYSQWLLDKEKSIAKKALQRDGYHVILPEFCNCIAEGDIPHVKEFMKAGFSPSAIDSKGVPMVCLAARSGHGKVLNLLVERGADIHAVSEDRENNALMDAVSVGNENMVHTLVKEGVDLNATSKSGQTALILAAGRGDYIISKILVEAGADLEVEDSMGMSASGYSDLFGTDEMKALFEDPLKSD